MEVSDENFEIFWWRVGRVYLYQVSEGRPATRPAPVGFEGGRPPLTAPCISWGDGWLGFRWVWQEAGCSGHP